MDATGVPVVLRVDELAPGQSRTFGPAGEEAVVVLLSGRCDVRFDDGPHWERLGGRKDVFDGKATALYTPVGRGWRMTGGPDGVRFAVASAPASTPHEPYVVRPGEVRSERRGTGVYSREVHDIVGPEQPSDGLLVGETFSDEGVWSSYPPHKHDAHDPPHESHQREAFHVRVDPPSGFGVFLHYASPEVPRQAQVVHDGDTVTVRDGYHSFVAAAGHRFYYLWALAGTERQLHFRTDPRHTWLLDGTR
ncbi:5-deoxy-glucuronate isomerase [Streptomyces sp. SID8352]|uniref:5-deoxy-glucuronate isomerase n=1 Tax=Streptomyces sp. SID8352 TaxID=2690338 RepID=UPI0013693DD2|nr:5-deoxy-glucuronate isomerase [Streptomyces sp. SID8352]MYU23645.1 5-deoxy-glucuronate isomerase [Streptomyces sp. SID8352]